MFYSCEQYFVFHCRYTAVSVFVILIQSHYPEINDGIWTLPVLCTRWLNCNICTLIKWILTILYCNCTQAHGQNLVFFMLLCMPPWWWPCRGRNLWKGDEWQMIIYYLLRCLSDQILYNHCCTECRLRYVLKCAAGRGQLLCQWNALHPSNPGGFFVCHQV